MTDIIYASAKTMAQAIQNKEVSAVELVDAHLARIEEAKKRDHRRVGAHRGGEPGAECGGDACR